MATATKKKALAAAAKNKGKKSSRKNVAASSAHVLATKQNAERTAQPGIIASIMSALEDAKGKKQMLTVEEIVAVLQTKFPDRPIAGMTTTVRAQLSRLPNEKDFKIKSLRDGRRMRYVAA